MGNLQPFKTEASEYLGSHLSDTGHLQLGIAKYLSVYLSQTMAIALRKKNMGRRSATIT